MKSCLNLKVSVYPLLLMVVSLATGSCSKANPTTPAPVTVAPRPFVIFSQIRYNSTPADLSQFGLSSSMLHSSPTLLSPNPNAPTTGNPGLDDTVIDSTKIATQEKNDLSLNPNVPVVLDIECWSFSAAQLPTTVADFNKVIRIYKATNPTASLGFYATFPQDRYVWDRIVNPADYQSWQTVNNALAPVVKNIRFFAPSLYTRDAIADSAKWRLYALANIREAKRYNVKAAVYAYIEPQYAKTAVFLSASYWQYQLEELYKMGYDGVIIWTSNKDSSGNILNFTTATQQDWWTTTLAFIKAKNIKAQ
jgi:hypothetical protein